MKLCRGMLAESTIVRVLARMAVSKLLVFAFHESCCCVEGKIWRGRIRVSRYEAAHLRRIDIQ
jgi:hypothetical protein